MEASPVFLYTAARQDRQESALSGKKCCNEYAKMKEVETMLIHAVCGHVVRMDGSGTGKCSGCGQEVRVRTSRK